WSGGGNRVRRFHDAARVVGVQAGKIRSQLHLRTRTTWAEAGRRYRAMSGTVLARVRSGKREAGVAALPSQVAVREVGEEPGRGMLLLLTRTLSRRDSGREAFHRASATGEVEVGDPGSPVG